MMAGSLPQIATEWTLTSASPTLNDGTGTSVTRKSPKSNSTAAFIVLGVCIRSPLSSHLQSSATETGRHQASALLRVHHDPYRVSNSFRKHFPCPRKFTQ